MWRWVSICLLPLVDPLVCLSWHKVAGGLLDVGPCKSGLCHPISPLFVVPSEQTTSIVLRVFVPFVMQGEREMVLAAG